MISKYFTFEDFTKTSNAKLQIQNRNEALSFTEPITATAKLMDGIQDSLGLPLDIHSGFRCPALNGSTAGSSKKSQHMKGEACDFMVKGVDGEAALNEIFNDVLTYLIGDGIQFGQLIRESAQRSYGTVVWLHLSLGAPWRDIAVCGQVLTMKDSIYTLLKQVPFGR